MKLSHDKATYPGAKQVWRLTDKTGKYATDLIALADEEPPLANSGELVDSARPLLEPAMKQGRVVEGFARTSSDLTVGESDASFVRLNRARDHAADERKRLPDDLLRLESEAKYPVGLSRQLEIERDRLARQIKSQHSDLAGTR